MQDMSSSASPNSNNNVRELLSSHASVFSRKLLAPSHADSSGLLRASHLLQWLDAVSCLAAERASERSMVTANMSDLHLFQTVPVANCLLTLEASVTRTFSSSLEVYVQGTAEQLLPGADEDSSGPRPSPVCSCYFIYVVLKGPEFVPSPLPAILPDSPLASLRFSEASERRLLRQAESQQRLSRRHPQPAAARAALLSSSVGELAGGQSTQAIELVLPQHANHHGTTFGGHVMSLMEECAFACAARFFRRPVALLSVDDLAFLSGSSVGDRLVLKASVNRAFGPALEVGVRVDRLSKPSSNVCAPLDSAKVNAGYLTYQLLPPLPPLPALSSPLSSSFSLPCSPALAADLAPSPALVGALPEFIPQSAEERRRFDDALERLRARMARHALRSDWSGVSIPTWEEGPVGTELISSNLLALMHLDQDPVADSWWQVKTHNGILLQTRQKQGLQLARFSFSVARPAATDAQRRAILDVIQGLLLDAATRSCWDALFCFEPVHQVDESSCICRTSLSFPGRPVRQSFVLRSVRIYQDTSRLRLVIANRSVKAPGLDLGPNAVLTATDLLPSGWCICVSSSLISLSYILQIPPITLADSQLQQELVGETSHILSNLEAFHAALLKRLV